MVGKAIPDQELVTRLFGKDPLGTTQDASAFIMAQKGAMIAWVPI